MATNLSDSLVTNEENDYEDVPCLIRHSREKYATIAEDTLNKFKNGWYRFSDGQRIDLEYEMRFSVDNSRLYTENDPTNIKKTTSELSSSTIFEVRCCTTLQAAQSLVSEINEDRIGVLNFASGKNPGGGFLRGSSAQEESLARSSSLYFAISQDRIFPEFYGYNRRGESGLYSDRLIYSPRITILKDDNGTMLSSPYHVGMVTIPAPNASVIRDRETIRNAMRERIKRLLDIFAMHEHDTLVLGAFGCGVFQNDPLEVALIFRQHLKSKRFENCFQRIVFAISNPQMCRVFQKVFSNSNINDVEPEMKDLATVNDYHQYQNKSKQRKKLNKRS